MRKTQTVAEKISGGNLSSLGIHNPTQLLLTLPIDYVDYRHVISDIPIPHAGIHNLRVRVTGYPSRKTKGAPRTVVPVTVGEHQVELTAFGVPYPWMQMSQGDVCHVRCKIGEWDSKIQLQAPQLIPEEYIGKMMPVYRGKKGKISSERLSGYVRQCLLDYPNAGVEYILQHFQMSERALLQESGIHGYTNIAQIIIEAHSPDTPEQASLAVSAARKIAAYEVVWMALSKKLAPRNLSSVIAVVPGNAQNRISTLPFQATTHQQQAIQDILRDLESPQPMNRLLSGDVGHGKSAVIQITAATARDAGAKVAILTPNTLLVHQLHDEFMALDHLTPVSAVISGSKIPDISNNPIVIGTTALLSKMRKLNWVPDYLIVDEQEKFSREQRENLAAEHTNILEATATCIPRTGALVMHGGMDISILNMSPVVKKISSHVVTQDDRKRVMEHVKKVVESGGQVAIVYPLVQASSSSSTPSKKHTETAYMLWEKLLPGRIGMIHGKMSVDEKQEVIQRMKNRQIDVLVSSTVIERGLTLPSLKCMVVVDAWRYGLSQLHQMRGRLARHGGTGTFLMMAGDCDEDAMMRLKLLETIADGFTLAERDLEIRGFGDLSDDSENQSGVGRSRLFNGVKITPMDIAAIQNKSPTS